MSKLQSKNITTLYRDTTNDTLRERNPQQHQPTETIISKNGKQVTFHSEVHGTIQHIAGGERKWRYMDYELQVQASNGYWLGGYEKWTPYHEAVDWAVEQHKLRRYVAEVHSRSVPLGVSEKVVELDAVRRKKQTEMVVESPETLNEYAISYYTEVDEEGIPTEEKVKFYTPYLFDERSIKNYMSLIIPGSIVMDWNLCNPDFDEF